MMRRPLFIARQARHPTGLLGRIIASIMARETSAANHQAIDLLSVQPGDHVLDIGCGSGLSLARLSTLAVGGHVSGVDPSAVMAERARQLNSAVITAGRADVQIASADGLPYADDGFDKVMSVYTVYFWPDLDQTLSEIARVTKAGGFLCLMFRTAENAQTAKNFPKDIYHFRSMSEIGQAAKRAGFALLEERRDSDQPGPAWILARKLAN